MKIRFLESFGRSLCKSVISRRRRRSNLCAVLLVLGILIFVLRLDNELGSGDSTIPMIKVKDPNPVRISDLINLRYWALKNASFAKPKIREYGNFDQILSIEKKLSIAPDETYNLWRPRNLRVDGKSVMDPDDRVMAQLVLVMEEHKKTLNKKTIYLENSFSWWNMQNSTQCLEDCPHFSDRCRFVDRSLHRPNSSNTDAVITSASRSSRPHYANSKNIFVFSFFLESNYVTSTVLWTQTDILSSYWRGSGLITPYGKWAYYDPAVTRQKQVKNYAEGKTKLIAAFISNCYPVNSRSQYVAMLQKYISVHVYGDCGAYTCPRSTESQCFEMLRKDYKFYLSFENANCRDYITEKFWNNALLNDVVPIVMGAHPDDYKALSPANSYIHVEDFQNPKKLATYLKFLDEHDEEYNKYFEWKGTGESIRGQYFCRVCAMLHYAERSPPPPRTTAFDFGDVDKNGLCLERGQAYWTRNSSLELE